VTDFLPLIAEYRAGLEAEMAMLRHLAGLAAREREVTAARQLDVLDELTDVRERVMATLVTIESQLRPIRQALAEARPHLARLEEFKEVADLHQQAAALVGEIVASDEQSMAALRQAEHARRFAAESLEKGESTLAAYRRVVMPALPNATLVNRRG